jgi:hypothetical protein
MLFNKKKEKNVTDKIEEIANAFILKFGYRPRSIYLSNTLYNQFVETIIVSPFVPRRTKAGYPTFKSMMIKPVNYFDDDMICCQNDHK